MSELSNYGPTLTRNQNNTKSSVLDNLKKMEPLAKNLRIRSQLRVGTDMERNDSFAEFKERNELRSNSNL